VSQFTYSSGGAVLGTAGAESIFRDFPNAPLAGTWYPAALANSLAGTDLGGVGLGHEEIYAQFNLDIDNGTCLSGITGWYYGTDPVADPPPADTIPLLPVVFHELAHGLGFQTFTNTATGGFNGGLPDIWASFLADAVTGTTWRDMATNSERQASAISDPNLIWTGPNVTANLSVFLDPAPSLIINSPESIAGQSLAKRATFGGSIVAPGVTGDVVAALPADGCVSITNPEEITGNIALIDRGACTFTVKVANAEAAGAVAVIVANNVPTGLPSMAGADPNITIPSYGVLQSVGASIRDELVSGAVNVTLGFGTELSATNGGFIRMYAPNPRQQLYSVSHFTLDAFPSLFMAPNFDLSRFGEADLAISLFRDIGWSTNPTPDDRIFFDGFE
jgi:hypothetical protein